MGYNEPETLSYAISSICPKGADGGHCTSWSRVREEVARPAPPLPLRNTMGGEGIKAKRPMAAVLFASMLADFGAFVRAKGVPRQRLWDSLS